MDGHDFPVYPDVAALPPHLQDMLAAHAPVNVYRMVMHTPGLAPAFFAMADAMFQANSLPPHLRELAILRVGHRYDAPYETHQHTLIATYSGLSETAIDAAATGAKDGLPQEEADVIAWTDALLDHHTLSADERDDALRTLSLAQLADLVMTVGFYQLVCNFLNAFGVTTEGEPNA